MTITDEMRARPDLYPQHDTDGSIARYLWNHSEQIARQAGRAIPNVEDSINAGIALVGFFRAQRDWAKYGRKPADVLPEVKR